MTLDNRDVLGMNQQLGIDVGHVSVWKEQEMVVAGGENGVVKVWEGNAEEGRRMPIGHWEAHKDAVSSAVIHPSGCVVATSSGSRKVAEILGADDEGMVEKEQGKLWDNSLKIWAVE